MAPRIDLLVNPASGNGRAAVAASRLLRELRGRGAEVTVLVGGSADDSRALARKSVAGGTDALVAVGGDGLVHAALQEVVGGPVPLGILPTGTGNDIAREFGLPRSVRAAADVILGGTGEGDPGATTVVADTVRACGRHYLSVLACGFDARVNERVNGYSLRLGRLAYLVGVLAELRSFAPIPYVVEVDGEPLTAEGMLVAVGNTTTYGGGMRVCPDAVSDDGQLDVVLVHAVPRARFLRCFPRVFAGTHTRMDEVTSMRGSTVTITVGAVTGARPVTGYADGERIGDAPITCEVVPRSVRLLAPAR